MDNLPCEICKPSRNISYTTLSWETTLIAPGKFHSGDGITLKSMHLHIWSRFSIRWKSCRHFFTIKAWSDRYQTTCVAQTYTIGRKISSGNQVTNDFWTQTNKFVIQNTPILASNTLKNVLLAKKAVSALLRSWFIDIFQMFCQGH